MLCVRLARSLSPLFRIQCVIVLFESQRALVQESLHLTPSITLTFVYDTMPLSPSIGCDKNRTRVATAVHEQSEEPDTDCQTVSVSVQCRSLTYKHNKPSTLDTPGSLKVIVRLDVGNVRRIERVFKETV